MFSTDVHERQNTKHIAIIMKISGDVQKINSISFRRFQKRVVETIPLKGNIDETLDTHYILFHGKTIKVDNKEINIENPIDHTITNIDIMSHCRSYVTNVEYLTTYSESGIAKSMFIFLHTYIYLCEYLEC